MSQRLAKILLVVSSVIFALILCEAGLRLLGIEYPHFYEFDPIVGARLRPGIRGYWLKEGGGYVSINSDGLRDREHAIRKPANTLRIAVLGDSYAEAMHVNQDKTFWAIMEKRLRGCPHLHGRQVEVINFGQAGFGTAQELLALRYRVWKYSPDLVLLAFCTGNDMSDNSPILNEGTSVPFYVFQNGKLVLDDTRIREAEKVWSTFKKNRNWLGYFSIWSKDTFRTLQVIEQCQRIVRYWWSSKVVSGLARSASQGELEPVLWTDIYRKPKNEAWKEAWKITEAILLMMRDEISRQGAQFYVVVLTNNVQVGPDMKVLKQVAKYPGIEDLSYPDHRIEKFCQSHGIPVLLLVSYFQAYASQHHEFLHLGPGHWNQKGHCLAGEIIAQWLCPQMN
jgi:hypothetical protein